MIDVSKNRQIDRDEIVAKALEEGDIIEGPISADQALRRVEKKLGVIWSLPEGYTIDGVTSHISKMVYHISIHNHTTIIEMSLFLS